MKNILALIFAVIFVSNPSFAQLSTPQKMKGVIALGSDNAALVLNTQLPYDNTTPLITEGNEIWTSAITCKSQSDRMIILSSFSYSSTASSGSQFTCVLFQGSSVIHIKSEYMPSNGKMYNFNMTHTRSCQTAGTVFSIRCGMDTSGDTTISGVSGASFFGGTSGLRNNTVVMEYAP